MGITGNLKTMALAELLQWLSQGQKTGTLVFESGDVEKRVVFDSGIIISSASTDPAEYLGNFLTARGLATDEQVDEALARQKTEGKLLGKLLIELGVLDEEQLQEVLQTKAEESIYDIFTWEQGDFRFLDGDMPEEMMVPISLDVQWIVLEGSRRVDELGRLREHVPSPLCVPVGMTDLEELEVEDTDARILSWVDDDRSVEDISREARVTTLLVTQVLAQQVETGTIKMVRPRIIEVKVPVEREGSEAAPAPQQTVVYAPMPGGYPPAGSYSPQPFAPPGQVLDSLRNHPSFGGGPGSAEPATPTPPTAAAAPGADLSPEVAGALAEAQRAVRSGELDTALGALKKADELGNGESAVVSAVGDSEKQLVAALESAGITPTAVPRLSCDMTSLTQLKISPAEGFMLTRVNGSYDIKSLLKMHPAPMLDTQILFWKLKKSGHVAF